ncbi:MAG: phosphodiesterase [Woeseiaceae bacterium]
MKIFHLTDPHLFADAGGELRGSNTRESLQRVLDHYQQHDWRAELAVITGDLIQDDSAAAYENFRDALTPLGLPLACLPGNHDVRALMQAALNVEPFAYCPTLRRGNWLLISVDSCVTGKAGGCVADAEMKRLQQLLDDGDAEHVAVFLHHPPVEMGSRWLDSVGLQNAEEFLGLLQAHSKVRAAVFGHVHQPYDAQHGSVRVIGTPSTCRQFKEKSDVFAVDERPPAYRRLVLRPDGGIDTLLMWVNHA